MTKSRMLERKENKIAQAVLAGAVVNQDMVGEHRREEGEGVRIGDPPEPPLAGFQTQVAWATLKEPGLPEVGLDQGPGRGAGSWADRRSGCCRRAEHKEG